MKNFFRIMANVLTIAALAAGTVACSDEDEGRELTGYWVFREINFILYMDGETYDTKDLGIDVSSYSNGFRGLFFVFENDRTFLAGMDGESEPMGKINGKS
ncbi:MAG: hypothetical protein LBS42_04205 [Tannerella sp.]|jgi:hypothetical protein|nr:hypothetical protein [Tannerella sp.]